LRLVAGVWPWQLSFDKEANETTLDFKQHNFRFVTPHSPWKRDQDLEQALKVKRVFARKNPFSWVALYSRDYDTRTPASAERRAPRSAELIDEAVAKLRGYFKEVEWELKETPEKLASVEAVRLEFRGEADAVAYEGEVVAMTSRGFGYWVLTWTVPG